MLFRSQSFALPMDSVSLSNPTVNSHGNIELSLEVFPSSQECFNQTTITMVGFALNNLSFNPPAIFGPFKLMAYTYGNCAAGNSEFHAKLESNSYYVFSMLFGCYCNFITMHTLSLIIEVPIALNKSSGIIIGVAVGGSVLLLLVVLAVVYAFHQKKIAERASEQNNPFGKMGIT